VTAALPIGRAGAAGGALWTGAAKCGVGVARGGGVKLRAGAAVCAGSCGRGGGVKVRVGAALLCRNVGVDGAESPRWPVDVLAADGSAMCDWRVVGTCGKPRPAEPAVTLGKLDLVVPKGPRAARPVGVALLIAPPWGPRLLAEGTGGSPGVVVGVRTLAPRRPGALEPVALP